MMGAWRHAIRMMIDATGSVRGRPWGRGLGRVQRGIRPPSPCFGDRSRHLLRAWGHPPPAAGVDIESPGATNTIVFLAAAWSGGRANYTSRGITPHYASINQQDGL